MIVQPACRDQVAQRVECDEKTQTARVDVVGGHRSSHPNCMTEQGGVARHRLVWCPAGSDEAINIAQGEAGRVERTPRRISAEVGGGPSRFDVPDGHARAPLDGTWSQLQPRIDGGR